MAGGIDKQPPRRRAIVLVHVVAIVVVAELLIALASSSPNEPSLLVAMLLYVFLLTILALQASLVSGKDLPLALFLAALVLVPLLRIVSLVIPLTAFSRLEWLAIVSIPLLLAVAAVVRAQRLRPADIFLGLGARAYVPLNIAVIVLGFGLGLFERQILQPEPWIRNPTPSEVTFAVFVVFLATGLTEELIFRGVLLARGVGLLGRREGLLYVTVVFTALHIGFTSPAGLLLVFLIGLAFGLVVLKTGALWGVVGSHTLANVALYVITPPFV